MNPMATAGKDNDPIGKKKMSFGTLMRKAVTKKRAESEAPLPEEEKDDDDYEDPEMVTQITSAEDPDDFDLNQIIPTPSLLQEKQDTARLEHNIKGLTSTNARRRRQSRNALLSDFHAANHKPRHRNAKTSGGGMG